MQQLCEIQPRTAKFVECELRITHSTVVIAHPKVILNEGRKGQAYPAVKNYLFVLVTAFTILAYLPGSCAGFVQEKRDEQKLAEVRVKVLVPLVEIAPYSLFQDAKKFTLIEYPKIKLREQLSDTITSFDQIKGKQARHYKLRAGEPIYKNDVCENADGDIDPQLKPSDVAMAIKLSSDQVHDSLKEGDRVDITITIPPEAPDKKAQTKNIDNIEVLSFEPLTKKEKQDKEANPKYRLVLRVTINQALVIKTYEEESKLDVRKHKEPESKK